MKLFKKSILLFFIILNSCSQSTNDKKSNASAEQNNSTSGNSFLSSYEADDGCTTGRHVFTATSEESIASQFCEALKDESLNNNCANSLRINIFKLVKCQGEMPKPEYGTTNLYTSFNQSYAFRENSCGTGLHIIFAADQKKSKELYCKALLDDSLNRNCAKDQRLSRAAEVKCD